MTKSELTDFILKKKKELGERVRIVGYKGQFDDLLEFSDIIGDAYELVDAVKNTKAEFLVFTGWRFFSDIACIFAPDKKVIQANIKNDCPLAEIIDENDIKKVYTLLKERCTEKEVIPIGYVAAHYKIRSYCGENNGTTCTPANALKVIEHYLKENKSIFFIPANDAFNIITALNLPEDEIFVIKKDTDLDTIPANKKIYAWNVECYVHTHYKVDDIKKLKDQNKDIKIIGHKECAPEILEQCDYTGFVGDIYQILKEAPSGSSWGVGTVDTWVKRAAYEYSDKNIVSFRTDLVCLDMKITDYQDIAESLQSIEDYINGEGELKTQIDISEEYRENAGKALTRMFEICK
ncbi:quinolinate synthase NadA [Anaerosacchariphilus polymeriproducens]|nr:quinolinate synthase NadA [Anaerosacchariphilus polymeriproducens]